MVNVGLRCSSGFRNREVLCEILHSVRELGFSSFWFTDHLKPVKGYLGFLEEEQYDSLVAIGFSCGMVEGLEFGTAAYIGALSLPERLAQQVATLWTISRGNFCIGLATGWNRSEFDDCGLEFSQRGRRLDRVIDGIRERCADVPILLAGGAISGGSSLGMGEFSASWVRRMARVDGWLVRPQAGGASIRRGLELIGEHRDLGGGEFRVIKTNYICILDSLSERSDAVGRVLGMGIDDAIDNGFWIGNAKDVVAQVGEVLESGVTDLVLHPLVTSVEELSNIKSAVDAVITYYR